jgi:thiamine-phosphate pyrophosphorylase
VNPQPLRYAISDRNAGAKGGRTALREQAARLAVEGVDYLQLREKDLAAGDLAALARELLAALDGSRTRLLVNGRADVAVAVAAHGVHLTSSIDELTPVQIHWLYRQAGLPPPLVTVSCHSLEDIARHRSQPVSAILFGPVFEKSVAGQRLAAGTGLALLRQACIAAAPIPVLALGGVTAANTEACLEAGASGTAGIRLFQ